MRTALQKLRGLWGDQEHLKALKLAASWRDLGAHKKAIQQGWAAASNPAFYRQMGRDPYELEILGLAALAEKFELPESPAVGRWKKIRRK